MPKEQFFNLTKDKQQMLIYSAKQEFERVPFELASINQIVKNSNISRGSFYIYFENKLDLLKYIMEDYKKEFNNNLYNTTIKSDGNVFEIFISIFDYIITYITTNDDFKFMKNIFANLKVNSQIGLPKPDDIEMKKCIDIIKEKINKSNFKIKDNKDINDLIEILVCVTKFSIVDIAFFNKEVDNVKERYVNKLKIIQNGIY